MRDGTILIVTTPIDPEAIVCAAAAAMQDIECQIWNTNEFPSGSRHTFSVSNDHCELNILDPDNQALQLDSGSVWLRELCAPEFYSTKIDDLDKSYVELMCKNYYKQLFEYIRIRAGGRHSFWINEISSANRAESKLAQLSLAVESGFKLPSTIISNDPERISAFYHQHAGQKIIRKSLYPYQWEEEGRVFSNKTSLFDLGLVQDLTTLEYHPEIFQAHVDKHAEVRVVFFGNTHFSVIIDPGDERTRMVDWRVYHAHSLGKARAFILPQHIADHCTEIMTRLGIVTGSFDLFIDEDGEYLFGEVNQGGLFFWMERLGLPVIDAFLSFCLSKDAAFRYDGAGPLLLDNVLASSEYRELESVRRIRQERRTCR